MTSYRELEKKLQPHLGSVLIVALVAVSAFMLGSDYQAKQNSNATVGAAESTTNTSATTIDEIKETIESPNSEGTVVSSGAAASKININTAGLSELDSLPGIGPKYAQAIIDYRNQNGLFVSINDLEKVKGIGPKTIDKFRDQITL